MPGIVKDPADWRGPDMAQSTEWVRDLTVAEVDEIDAAFRNAGPAGADLRGVTREDFPLPGFATELADLREALETGPGIRLFRGFPVERYTTEELRLIYWGIGVHIGTAVSQSKRGDVLGDVRDIGTDINTPDGRGYTSNAELVYHCDTADVTGLFCVKTPKSGGMSMAVSSVAVHNEIARTRPDLLEVLYTPFPWSFQGQERPGEKQWYFQPVYGMAEGKFCSRLIRTHIESSQRFDDAPRLSAAQIEALDLVDTLVDDPAFRFTRQFARGDILFMNNHVTYHARTEFEDWPEPEQRRHLMRMWLSVPNSRPLTDDFAAIYRDRRPGAVRGGFPGHGETPAFATG